MRGDAAGPGYTKPPPEVGRLDFLQACRAEGSGGGGGRRGLGGVWGGGGGGGLLVALPQGGGGGWGGGKRPAPVLLVPNGGPAHGLHPRFVVA